MKNYIKILLVMLTMFFYLPEHVFARADEPAGAESISGILVKIDETRQFVYIKNSQRIMKFYASSEICSKYKDSINAKVKVCFTRKKGGGLLLLSMQVDP